MLRNCSASGRIESVRGASSSGRARGSQSRGERFKSAALHQISNQKPAGEEAERDFCFFAVARPPWGSVFVFFFRTGHLHLQRPVRTSLSRF